jgi:hypothetical protein
MAKNIQPLDNESLFEIRYKPNAKLLDHRGEWAEKLSKHMSLEHWQIVENRLDVFSEDKERLLFLAYRNGGAMLINIPNKDYFYNFTNKLINFVMALEHFGDPIYIERIGVRNKFCTPFPGTFESLRNRYATRYFNIPDKAKTAIGVDAELIDVGVSIDFKDSIGEFKTMTGPMTSRQFPEFFSVKEGFPSVGIFYDIDYSVKPKKNLASREIISTLQTLYSAGWDRYARVRDLLIKG